MYELTGGFGELGWVAVKAFLLFLTAVLGFRLGERRTLAEMAPFDFVVAVAAGSIVGRVPNSETTSFLAGATTLVTLLIAHRVIVQLRYYRWFSSLVDHSPRLLVVNGKVLERELRGSGLTSKDLYGLLRSQGLLELREAKYVIFEQRGKISVIRHTGSGPDPELVQNVVNEASSGQR